MFGTHAILSFNLENAWNEQKRHCRIGKVTVKVRPVDLGIAKWRKHVKEWRPLMNEPWKQTFPSLGRSFRMTPEEDIIPGTPARKYDWPTTIS